MSKYRKGKLVCRYIVTLSHWCVISIVWSFLMKILSFKPCAVLNCGSAHFDQISPQKSSDKVSIISWISWIWDLKAHAVCSQCFFRDGIRKENVTKVDYLQKVDCQNPLTLYFQYFVGWSASKNSQEVKISRSKHFISALMAACWEHYRELCWQHTR